MLLVYMLDQELKNCLKLSQFHFEVAHDRPEFKTEEDKIGHWGRKEDLIVGKNHKGYILLL